MVKYLRLIARTVVVFLILKYIFIRPRAAPPEVSLNEWWGPHQSDDTEIRPYTVKFDPEIVKDLKDRLKNHRPFTEPLEGVGFEYGFNTKTLETWVRYWQEKYDFDAREKFLNRYPHFKTKVQGLDLHFIRVTPEVPQGTELVPMLLLHGWPGSVREFYEAIPHLTAVSGDRDFALELIIPSLPGFGFSEGTNRRGMGPIEIAVIMRNLMRRVGFEKFYIQGGDYGALIAAIMATLFPEEVLGQHNNMPVVESATYSIITLIGSLYPPLVVDSKVAERIYPMTDMYRYLLEETGYLHIQATKPDTVGISLLDSPSGLLAYIGEKFSTWTRKEHKNLTDGGLEFRFTKDQILDNIMVYWSTRSIITSMRLYSETFNKKHYDSRIYEVQTPVPTWALQAKNELQYVPPFLLKIKYTNLLNSTDLDDGGHFLALELPEVFSEDVLTAISSFRAWHRENNVNKAEL